MTLMDDKDGKILYNKKNYLIDGMNIVINILKNTQSLHRKGGKYYRSRTRCRSR